MIPRAQHTISRKSISPNALKVLYRLHDAGFGAYLVGGCVRDMLLGRQPKDFDIATNAKPDEVRRLFKNCRLIGKRFRLAHILFGREIIEVATFRTHHENAETQHGKMHEGMIIRDNVFGTIEDDAWRRDFRVNALYYNIADFSIIDYTGGIEDITTQTLHIIGDPEKRFHEDPVRLLRAARLAGKLHLNLSADTEQPMQKMSLLLQHVSSARLYQEVLKIFAEGALLATFRLLKKYHLFSQLFAQTAACLENPLQAQFIEKVLAQTDERLKSGKTVSPAFLFSALLWYPIQQEASKEEKTSAAPLYTVYEKAIHTVLKTQTLQLAIPRALQITIRDICFLQFRFTQRFGTRPYRVLEHPRYRAAYDLLLLRHQTGEEISELSDWWTAFQNATPEQRETILRSTGKNKLARKRKKPRKTARSYSATHSSAPTSQKNRDKSC